MNRIDRMFAILLHLRSRRSVIAADLAQRFEVSARTIYRDLETLGSLGVPVYAERGRVGGFQLLDGYFLPPLMLTREEAVSLLVGLTLMRSLRARPYPKAMESAGRKLLAAVPEHLRAILSNADKLIGFEPPPTDIFHPEPVTPGGEQKGASDPHAASEDEMLGVYLQAIIERHSVVLHYRSPYRPQDDEAVAEPLGLFWDRDRWYLAGQPEGAGGQVRFWRSDRLVSVRADQPLGSSQPDFDVRALLGRNWLQSAMEKWRRHAPVAIRLTPTQAERLRQDWYYRHAAFEPTETGQVLMTFGEADPEIVLELVRWLGPGAELLRPEAWRARIREDLKQMWITYSGGSEP